MRVCEFLELNRRTKRPKRSRHSFQRAPSSANLRCCLFDWWVEKYGRNLQAFWPVADTAIGRLGIMMAMEGNYPENGRGLALNGAEVVYRASLPAPFTENDFTSRLAFHTSSKRDRAQHG